MRRLLCDRRMNLVIAAERETLEVSHVCQDSALLLLGALSGLMGQHQF